MKIGIIGTDSSHAIAFSTRLQQKGHEMLAYKGGSPIEISKSRIEAISSQLSQVGVPFVDTLENLQHCDAYLITSVDATQHREQFELLSNSNKPVFIDKPIAQSSEQAEAICHFAQKNEIPLMSCSALRFADCVQAAKSKSIEAVDMIVPLPMLEPYDYFYYGIHAIEMMAVLKNKPIRDVAVQCQEKQHFLTLHYVDGTVSTIRGDLQSRQSFQFAAHYKDISAWYEIKAGDSHFYDRLVDEIEQFFITKKSPVAHLEMLQTIRMLEQITISAKTMKAY